MNRFILIAMFIAGCSTVENVPTSTTHADTHVSDSDVVMEELHITLKQTNDVVENCVMPQFGLNSKDQTCEEPKSYCSVKDVERCPCVAE